MHQVVISTADKFNAVTGPFGALTAVDTFTLVRPRRDAAPTP